MEAEQFTTEYVKELLQELNDVTRDKVSLRTQLKFTQAISEHNAKLAEEQTNLAEQLAAELQALKSRKSKVTENQNG